MWKRNNSELAFWTLKICMHTTSLHTPTPAHTPTQHTHTHPTHHTHTLYLPINGLRVSAESRKAHSSAMRCSFSLSCSTIANTSDVNSSQAMWGYLEGKETELAWSNAEKGLESLYKPGSPSPPIPPDSRHISDHFNCQPDGVPEIASRT